MTGFSLILIAERWARGRTDAKVGVEDGDEGNGLLSGALRQSQEVGDVLGREDLGLGVGVAREEAFEEGRGVIELGERLQLRDLGRPVDDRKTLFDTADPCTSSCQSGMPVEGTSEIDLQSPTRFRRDGSIHLD